MITEKTFATLPDQMKPIFASMQSSLVTLTEENWRLRRELYGSRSERHISLPIFEPNGSLFNEAEAVAESDTTPAAELPPPAVVPEPKKKRGGTENSGGRKPLPEVLPRERVVHDLADAKKICPSDGATLVQIGEDVVEKLEIIPAQLKVIQHVYPKYGCPECNDHIDQACAALSAFPKAGCEPGLVAHILTQKYLYCVPLYRLESQFMQMGVDVSRVSMARWVIASADYLSTLIEEIKKYILLKSSIHADETTIQVLKGTGKAPTATSYMWALCTAEQDPVAVWFEFLSNRSAKAAGQLLEGFSGLLHADGYASYNAVIALQKILRVGCWAHVRRKFDVAAKDGAANGKGLSSQFLDEIQRLFLLERAWKQLTNDERILRRKEESAPIVEKIRSLIDNNAHRVPPKSKLGIAIGYLANEWEHMVVFLERGDAVLSNNRMENFIRPFAIGRKNWMFSDTVAGAEASAKLYSLIVTAKAHGLDVQAYLTALLTDLPKAQANKDKPIDLEQYLPWNWKVAQQN